MTPITERSALALAASIRRRELSAREVVEAHIARHRQWGPRINALVADRFESARTEAATADERVVGGSAPPPRPPRGPRG
jgi:Asp-tRNA(Asn)/Glu-tRNA(Gln) amidotransferase A subunit family amidase